MGVIEDQLAADKLLYTQVCAKITAIVTGAQEHSLNDTQVDQRVKNADLGQLRALKAQLENDIAEGDGEICPAVHVY